MAYEIQNILRGKSIVRVVGADAISLTMNAFSTNTTTETITSVKIAHVWWSTNNNVAIARNSNTVFSLYNSGDWNLHASGVAVANASTANVDITITGDGTCIMECIKESTYTPSLG